VIYLDGNSLGARPKSALARAQQVIAQEWGQDLIRSWNTAGWFDMPKRLGDRLAPLIGAAAGEVVVTDTTSLNLFKALAAAVHMQAQKTGAAPRHRHRAQQLPDRYLHGRRAWPLARPRLHACAWSTAWTNCRRDRRRLRRLMLTHVNYRTGYQHDMAALTAHAHAQRRAGVWDLAHSAGAVPVDLHAAPAPTSRSAAPINT
jgi:kynureninase